MQTLRSQLALTETCSIIGQKLMNSLRDENQLLIKRNLAIVIALAIIQFNSIKFPSEILNS